MKNNKDIFLRYKVFLVNWYDFASELYIVIDRTIIVKS